jgi:RNA polymerase sigma factor (sigma-70 family)
MEKMTDIELLQRYKETNNPDYRNQVINNNIGLLKYYVRHYLKYNKGYEFDDLLSFACIGTINGIDDYTKRNVFIDKEFKSFISYKIRWGILDYIREESYVPPQYFFKADKNENCKIPAGIHLISNIKADTKTPEEMFLENEQNDSFIDLINSVPKIKYRTVIYYRTLDMGFEEIGKIMSMTKQATHHLYKKGIQYMRNEIKTNPKYSNLQIKKGC